VGPRAEPAPVSMLGSGRRWSPFANVNLLDAEEGTRIRAAYSDNYGRLVALKNKYHPTNLFRLNQNIEPTT
jgi:hypothetical protein